MGGSTRLAIAVSHSSSTTRENALIVTPLVMLHVIAPSPIGANLLASMLLSNVPMAEALQEQRICSRAPEVMLFTR